jgi:hypothetical protein
MADPNDCCRQVRQAWLEAHENADQEKNNLNKTIAHQCEKLAAHLASTLRNYCSFR